MICLKVSEQRMAQRSRALELQVSVPSDQILLWRYSETKASSVSANHVLILFYSHLFQSSCLVSLPSIPSLLQSSLLEIWVLRLPRIIVCSSMVTHRRTENGKWLIVVSVVSCIWLAVFLLVWLEWRLGTQSELLEIWVFDHTCNSRGYSSAWFWSWFSERFWDSMGQYLLSRSSYVYTHICRLIVALILNTKSRG